MDSKNMPELLQKQIIFKYQLFLAFSCNYASASDCVRYGNILGKSEILFQKRKNRRNSTSDVNR